MTLDPKAAIEAQLDLTLDVSELPELGTPRRGKVRDIYESEESLILVTTDRVSAFDVVLGTIPFKGEILNAMALDAFSATSDIVPNHISLVPDPNVIVAKRCTPFAVEFVVRSYITGSLWRDFESGKAAAYEVDLPAKLRKDEAFARPILTPSTKAERGLHDDPISRREILARGLMTEPQWDAAEATVFSLFLRGTERAHARGLILVDTKYELGLDRDGKLTLIDEIHTPDSSRYWIAGEYASRFERGEPQAMLDKENLRTWLIEEHGFRGHGPPPVLTRDIRMLLATRYLEAYRTMTGETLALRPGRVIDRIRANLSSHGLLHSRHP